MKLFKMAFAAASALTLMSGAALSEPKALMLHQWATGSDAGKFLA